MAKAALNADWSLDWLSVGERERVRFDIAAAMRDEKVILTDERLPLASSARVAGELRVGLETELAGERGLNLTLVPGRSGEAGAAKLGLDEELTIEELGGRVEGRAGDARVDVVSRSDGVSEEHSDEDLTVGNLRIWSWGLTKQGGQPPPQG